jgi:L-ribulokinase
MADGSCISKKRLDKFMNSQSDIKYVIGVDYGTLSGRALLVRVSDGAEIASAVHEYSNGVMEDVLPATGKKLPPDWALQMPSDYLDVLKNTVPEVLRLSGINPNDVIGIATDFTACTVLPVTADGTPLNELPEFKNNPHAYIKLWKHHSAQRHADRINELAHIRNEKWISRYGGKISSEWEFAKALQLLEESPEVYNHMRYWIEAADWIIWQLCGNYVRNICTAGYKGIYQDGQYPSKDFLTALNPKFANFVTEKLEHTLGELGAKAGTLSKDAARWTGLPEGIAVAVGNVDAHVTAAAANAVNPGQMVAIMGTSTCHVMVSDQLAEVPGMCGVVPGGIVSGKLGYEAGQSGVGDLFGWFANNFASGEYQALAREAGVDIHTYLSNLASQSPIGSHGLVALDWHSGNRSTLVDHRLSSLIVGLTLATKPEEIYRAIVESTAFGARKIIKTFNDSGVPVKEFIAAGGLIKNKFVMQIYADVLNMPITVIRSTQGPALGSAIHAAVAAGAYKDVVQASAAMGGVEDEKFTPIPSNVNIYDQLFAHYDELYERFGHDGMMHDLRRIRDTALMVGGN